MGGRRAQDIIDSESLPVAAAQASCIMIVFQKNIFKKIGSGAKLEKICQQGTLSRWISSSSCQLARP
jgi:hypothetical protein